MKLKKIIASILAICMVLSTMSFPVYAEEATAVATVDGVEYTDIQTAITAAAPDKTVEVLSDVVVDEWKMFWQGNSTFKDIIYINMDGLTINGNGHTLTVNNIVSASNGDRLFKEAKELNIKDWKIVQPEKLGGISLVSGAIEGVTFNGGNGIFPGDGEIVIDKCTFNTDYHCIYSEEANDGLKVTNCEFNAGENNVIFLRGNTEFTGNTVKSGLKVRVVEGSPVVSGNDFGDVVVKVYNNATATIEGNTINNIEIDEPAEKVNSTFGENTLSESAETTLKDAGVIEDTSVETVVAQVGDTTYTTLSEAIDAAQYGDTVTLLSDLTIESDLNSAAKGYFNIAEEDKITLDLGEKTINVTDNSTGNFILFYNYGDLTIKNGTVNLTSTNNREWNAESAIILNRGGNLTIESGTYTHNGGTDMAFVVDNSGNYYGDAITDIEGGTLTSAYIAIRNRMEQNSHGASGKATLNISGGTITATKRAVWAQAASTSETSPATGAINVTGGEVGLIDTARSSGAECMTTISGGTVAEFKGEAGELTVTENGTITGTVTILTASGEEVDYVVDENGVYVEAPEVNYVVKIGETGYATLAEALTVASAMTGDVTVEIYDKVTLNQSLSGSYDSITFVGKDTDAEIYLDVQGYITATGKAVAFEDLKLSKAEGGFITNAGFMNVAFGVYDVTKVTYTDCTFANGAYASTGEVTYTGCTFYRSHDKYGLWAYGDADIIVDDCTFADYRGIKMYAEGAAKTTNLTVKDSDFSALTGKPAIVLTYGESVTLEGNTYSSTGVFELDLDGAPNGTPVTSTDKITCVNDNGACGVLVDGKIYTTVAQAAEVATEGSTVTLLHDSTETVELAEGVILDKNGYTAEDVTTKTTAVAQIGDITYSTLDEAIADANGETVTVLTNIVLTDTLTIPSGVIVTLDLNGKEVSMNYTNDSSANHAMIHNKGNLTILDSATGGKLSYKYSGADLGTKYSANTVTTDFGSVLTVESGTIENLTYDSAIIAYAIDGLTNGNGGDVTININGGTITSQRQAIRIFANSTTKTGYLNISGGEFTGRLIIQNANAKANKAALNITGGIFNANGYKTDVLYVGGSNGVAIDMTAGVSVSGGTFNGEISSSITTKFISGGTFSTDVSAHVADDYKLVKNENGTYGVEEKTGLSGAGTKEDPYLITNMDELKWFRDDVNDTQIDGSNQYTGKYIKLTSDIDLGGEEWTPIGVYDQSKDHINFQGIFDGDGHTIYNLKINSTNRAGFFGELGLSTDFGGVTTIKNITFENVDVVSTSGYVGAVASNPFCVTFDNVHVTGNINVKGGSYTAVIAGHGYANFNNCSVDGGENKGIVESTGWAVGGIAGYIGDFDSEFTNCTVKNLVVKTPICGAAAIAGYGADFKNSSNLYAENVDVIAESTSYPGCNGLLFGLYGAGDNFAAIANSSVKGCTLTEGGEKVELYYDMAAKLGDASYYTTLQSAVVAAKAGDTITMLSDVTLSEAIIIPAGADVTLDLNGKTITYNSTVQGEAMITNKGTLVINDSVGTGVINYNYTGVADSTYSKGNYTISNEGTLTVNGGKITIANLRAHAKYPINNNSTSNDAILVINGGHLYNYNTSGIRQFCNSTTYQNSVTINGGLIEGYSAIWVQNPGSKTVNGTLSITGGEIRTTAAAYVNGTAALKDVASRLYCTIDGNGGAWSETSAVSITGGIMNENVNLAVEAPAAITIDKENATFNGYVEIPASDTGLSGAGTKEDPYLITNMDELKWFRDDVNAGNTYDGMYIKLTTDINLNNEEWTPIGTSSNCFKGMFDGNNHTISNLYINWSTEYVSGGNNQNYVGLFGRMNGAGNDSGIKNLTIENADVSGCLYVGAVLGRGYTSGIIENCHVTGNVDIEGYSYIGGIVGRYEYSTGTTTDGTTGVSIYNCSVKDTTTEKGTINGLYEGATYIGGILGFTSEPNPVMCFEKLSVENISVTGFSRVGGISGIAHQANIYKACSVSKASIYGTDSMVGLIVGACQGTQSSPVTFTGNTVDAETKAYSNETEVSNLYGTNISGEAPVTNFVARVGRTMYETLADALAAAQSGETVVLLADVALDAPVTIKNNITIDGNGHNITQSAECNNVIALLYFEGSEENVLNITVKNTTFDGLKTGAAIRTLYVNMNIDNCVFQNCEHTVGQGLVRLTYGTANIINSKFLNNNCSMGISFNWDASAEGVGTDTLAIDNCEFTGNTANKTALVYYVKGIGCDIKNSEFKNNKVNCKDNGAVIYLGFQENCAVTGNLFEGNVVTESGTSTRVAGAIFFGYDADISGNAFINNIASNASGDTLGQICTSIYYNCEINLSENYWGGETPVYGKDYTVQHQTGEGTLALDSYYASYSLDDNGNVVLDDIKEIKKDVAAVTDAEGNVANYTDLQTALKSLTSGATLTLLDDVTITEAWDCRYNGAKITVPVTISGNGHTLKLTGSVNDKNWNTVFRFEADATVKNLTIDASEAIDIQRGISAKYNITVDNCTLIGNDTSAKRAVIFGEGAGSSITDVTATITDSTFTGWSYGVSDNQSGKDAKSVTITGSTFTGASVLISAAETITFTGNTVKDGYVNITSYTAVDTVKVTATGNTLEGTDDEIMVNPENITADDAFITPVAKIGAKYYETLEKAVSRAANGDTITMLSDVTLSEAIIIPAGADVTLDLNGKTVTYNSTVQGEAMITNKGTLEINDTVGTGVINYNYTGAADPSYGKGNHTISNGGTLTVNGGKITIANLRAHAKYPIDNNSTTGDAILVINGGHLYNYNTSAIRQFCNSTTYQNSVTINGGLIEGYSAIWVQNPGSKTVNGILSITGGEIRTTAAAYVNGSAELKDVSSAIYCTIASDGGAWDDASAVSITGGIINENVYLAEEAPATITVDKENASFNGYVEIPAPELPTATVTELENEDLTFALNFTADEATAEQLAYYGNWYADFVLTVNKDVTFNANGGADGYLSGQYDAWSTSWVNVPFEDVTLESGKSLKIMEYAAELMGQSGLRFTYRDVYDFVKDFDCGVFFESEFLAENPDLEVTLELRMYNPVDETESYIIGETYVFEVESVAYNTVTKVIYEDVSEALLAAKANETVVLLADAGESVVLVTPGVTLDLNGYSLTSDYVTSFGHIVDTADEKGTLEVAADCIHIYKGNEYLPVKNEGGYEFYKVTEIKQDLLADGTYAFLPYFEEALNKKLLNGQETTGVTINVRLSWLNDQGVGSQNFVYNDTIVNNVVGSYKSENKDYGRAFTLTVTGTEGLKELCYEVVIVSAAGVEIASEKLQVQTTVNE